MPLLTWVRANQVAAASGFAANLVSVNGTLEMGNFLSIIFISDIVSFTFLSHLTCQLTPRAYTIKLFKVVYISV